MEQRTRRTVARSETHGCPYPEPTHAGSGEKCKNAMHVNRVLNDVVAGPPIHSRVPCDRWRNLHTAQSWTQSPWCPLHHVLLQAQPRGLFVDDCGQIRDRQTRRAQSCKRSAWTTENFVQPLLAQESSFIPPGRTDHSTGHEEGRDPASFQMKLFAHISLVDLEGDTSQAFPSMPVCGFGTRRNLPTPDLKDRHSFLESLDW